MDCDCGQRGRGGPVFFFDQPTRQKWIQSNILHFYITSGGSQLDGPQLSQQEENQKGERNDLNTQKPSGEAFNDKEPDASSSSVSAAPKDLMDAYRRAAPHLLNKLAHLLSQHKWSQKDCIPSGIVNILNYSWHDLTAGASLRLRSRVAMTEKQGRSKVSLKREKTPRQVAEPAKEERGEGNCCVDRNAGSFWRKVEVKKWEKKNKRTKRASNSTAVRFSISACSCEDPGGIAQPKQHLCDEPESVRVIQWAVERLRAARNPQNLPPAEQDLNKAFILRHYGDEKKEDLSKRRRKRTTPGPLVDAKLQIPEEQLQNPAPQKLHYQMNDGSSFVFYPSGSIAVCQSCSCLPHGGFCTNVFADTQHPVTLMTITPFGHGAVTNPLYSTITAVWDQGGGLMFDDYGNITKEWSWQTYHTLRGEIIIQVSEEISVRLFSGTSGVLSFRCENESVQLPLSCVTNKSQLKKMELQQPKRQKHPAGIPESKRSLGKTPMVKEEEQQVEPLALWRRRGNAARELQRMQQRVRNTVESWLDFYRAAIGIKCPDTEPLPGAQKWTRQRRAVQLAALPSLNSPECKKAAQLHAGRRRRDELRENHRGLSAEKPRGRFVQMQRTLEKQGRNTSPVTQIGPLRIHGDIKPESVILSHPAGSEASPICSQTAMVPLAPSIPLTTCPALLRAALQGEERQRRRCCCSATQMPVVTDLEYDAFITGQPLHSKQILVVCVTPRQQPVDKQAATRWDALEDLYRRRNKRRTMPCTECQMDSFRLVRYEMSAGLAGSGPENVLLQQRHDAAPGMFLMYLNGKLLFLSHMFSDDSFSVKDLQTLICRSRKEHRLGLSLPTDHNSRYHCRVPSDWLQQSHSS